MKLLSSILLLSLTVMSQTNSKIGAQSNDNSSARFAKLTEAFMKQSLVLSPVNASQAGYHKHVDLASGKTIELDAELDDFSPGGIEAQRKFYSQWQLRLRRETPIETLGSQDAADWRLMDDQISQSLLEFDRIQSYKHNPTIYVELLGNALFLPLTQDYAPKATRVGHVLSRLAKMPALLAQAMQQLVDADPIYIKVALEENEGNIDLVQSDLKSQIPAGTDVAKEYDRVAPLAVKSLQEFSQWLKDDLAKRPNPRSWRLGKQLYDEKFKYVMESDLTPEQVLANADRDLNAVRSEMLAIALPMHHEMFPGHSDHADLPARERQNKIIGEVLGKIADDHSQRDQLMDDVKKDLAGITQFIREKKIVSLSDRDNLKVIPTPVFMRGIYSVGGFHQAPPLEPKSEAEYWVTPIDPKTPADKAESKLREYNNWVLKWLTIHEALPGHYVQFEHANGVEPENRRLLRALFGNGAYVEGWAEYVAQVMMDEGFMGHDPRFVLSMKKIRLRVIANAILDVRMHTMNMADDEALDLMMNSAFQTRAEAEGKLQRAKLSSTQLPTYYVGIGEWWQLRRQYQAREGKNFSLRAFHDAALDQGPLPVPLLAQILLAK